MSNIEILTRRNPKTSSMDIVGISTAVGLTSADISAACAGVGKTGELILLSKVCGDRSAEKPLFYGLHKEALELALGAGWKLSTASIKRIRSILQLAVYESITQLACPSCKGTKYNPFNPTKLCEPCKGVGRWRMSDSQKAVAIGISKQAWSKSQKYRYFYNDLLLMLDSHEHSALIKILKKLR